MKFCSHCGSDRLELRIPEGDTLPRLVCANCHTIHYQNPKVVVGCLPEWGEQVLLCKRAIEPRLGLWTLPAGFLENGETVTAGALRETLEEAQARVEVADLYTLISLPQINQVYMMFRSRLLDRDFGPGPESLEVTLFDEADIPWEALAFRTITRTLRNFFLDRKLGRFHCAYQHSNGGRHCRPTFAGQAKQHCEEFRYTAAVYDRRAAATGGTIGKIPPRRERQDRPRSAGRLP